MNVPIGKKADVVVMPSGEDMHQVFFHNRSYILDLASVNNLTLDTKAERPSKSAAGISDNNEVFVALEGLIDIDREKARLSKEIDRRNGFISGVERKLLNEGFLSKAPKEVIQQERDKLENAREELNKLITNLEALEN